MLVALLQSMRPHQWVKNLFVAAPLLFSKNLTNASALLFAAAAVGLFSLLSSSVYLVNDLFDIEKDRQHPKKKLRPIASGRLTINAARSAAALLIVISLGTSPLLGLQFFSCAAGYLVLNLAYSLALKHLPVLDVLSLASGFLLRVLAGSLAIDVVPSTWLLICTFVLASYLGFGKRAHELSSAADARDAHARRPVLAKYRLSHLVLILWILAAATCTLYVLYTISEQTKAFFHTDRLVYSAPFAVVGVVRFLQIVSHHAAESPTDAMLRDWIFVLNFALWSATVVAIIYFL
jgi:4-hydroxybenzoate polyprenyltransferase